MKKYTAKSYLLGMCILTFSSLVKSESATLMILNDVRPHSVIEVQWQGPNNEQDQIVLMDSAGNEGSAQYTRAGNPVGIGIEEYSDSYKLVYKAGGQILTALNIDCRTESLSPDGLCIVHSSDMVQKASQAPINEPELKNESTSEQTNPNNGKVSSIDEFKALLDSIFR